MKPVGAWVLLGVGAAIGATDPAAHGPFPAARLGVGIPGTQGATLQTDLYFTGTTADGVAPAAMPCPVVVLGHGFSQSKERHANQGLHLASRGYIVLVPTFNGGSNHARNGQDMVRRQLDRCRPGAGHQPAACRAAIVAAHPQPARMTEDTEGEYA